MNFQIVIQYLLKEKGCSKRVRLWNIRVQNGKYEPFIPALARAMTGRVPAHDIKRIYLHEPQRIEENIPRTPRERRQAWKEGRLGDNPNPIVPDAEKSGKPKQQRQGRRQKKKRR